MMTKEVLPKYSKKIFEKLRKISDWDEGNLNVWRFERSVVDLYKYYQQKLINNQKITDEQLYYTCVGVVNRIGGEGVRDPVIVYLELLKSEETDKEKFIKQFKNHGEKYESHYEDSPNILDEDFFDYCFSKLEKAGLVEIKKSKLRIKDMFDFNINDLTKEGIKLTEEFNNSFFLKGNKS
jgi:hypothetical protein